MTSDLPINRFALSSFLIWTTQFFFGVALGETLPQKSNGLEEVPVSEEYFLRVWDTNDGLPSNRISSIAQTPDGYLWVATSSNGLARFDGVRFTPVVEPKLRNACVESLFTAKDGSLWIGVGRGGVYRLRGSQLEGIIEEGSSSGGLAPSSFAEDGQGTIWAALPHRRLCFIESGRPKKFGCLELPSNIGKYPIVKISKKGRVWFSTDVSCGVIDANQVQVIDSGKNGMKIAAARNGGIWEVRGRKLFRCYEDGRKQSLDEFQWLESGREITLLHEDREGNLWVGTKCKGLFRYREGEVVRVLTSQSSIRSLFEDREGNLWVGTDGGLSQVGHRGFSLRQIQDGLPNDSAISLCEDNQGHLWIVGRSGIPARSIDSTNRFFATPPGGWLGVSVMAVWPDPAGGVWMGTLADLQRWQDGSYTSEGIKEAITAGLVDRNGDLWIATIRSGLIRRHNGIDEKISTSDGLVQPRALAEDSEGRLWVGTEHGLLFCRQGERFIQVPLPDSQPDDQIRFIMPDEGKATMWIGTALGNLYWWRNGQLGKVALGASLPVSELQSLLIEPGGDFWFGTNSGLFRMARAEMEAIIKGSQSPIRATHYGRNDGLVGLEYAVGFRNATVRTRDGHLWFATYTGALEIDPSKLQKAVAPVRIIIESISFGENSIPGTSKGISLPPHPGTVQIQYAFPFLSAPEQVHFRYRLINGERSSWIEAQEQRSATFSSLAPGNYRFEVQAIDLSGRWKPRCAALEFKVRAAWWETGWFRLTSALGASGALIILVCYRFKQRMQARIKRLEQEQALERERARIARDMHDELGASLTQISLASQLAQMAPPEAASSHIGEITEITRRTVASLDELVWTVNPRNDNLPALLNHFSQYAHDYLGAAGIECEVDVPELVPEIPLPAHLRHHLLMAMKEALNNLIKHSKATAAFLKAQIGPNGLQITVADNGCGFELGPHKAGADGLGNFHDRMKEIQGTCRIESAPGQGTSIIFEVPLPNEGSL